MRRTLRGRVQRRLLGRTNAKCLGKPIQRLNRNGSISGNAHLGQHFDNLILHVRSKANGADIVTDTLNGATLNSMTLSGQSNKGPVHQEIQFAVIGTSTRAALG